MSLVNSFLAWISWPWPIEIARHSTSRRLAAVSISGVGSEPMLRKHTIGVSGRDSDNSMSTFSITGSVYLESILLATYFLDWAKVRSWHHALKIVIHILIKQWIFYVYIFSLRISWQFTNYTMLLTPNSIASNLDTLCFLLNLKLTCE